MSDDINRGMCFWSCILQAQMQLGKLQGYLLNISNHDFPKLSEKYSEDIKVLSKLPPPVSYKRAFDNRMLGSNVSR